MCVLFFKEIMYLAVVKDGAFKSQITINTGSRA